MKPHLFKVSVTQWACSPSINDKHILRCIFGDTAKQAFERYDVATNAHCMYAAIPTPLEWLIQRK